MPNRTALGVSSVFGNVILTILNLLAFSIGIYLGNSVDVHKHFIAGNHYDFMVQVIPATGMFMSVINFSGVIACSCALMTTAGRGGCGPGLALQRMLLMVLAVVVILPTSVLMIWESIRLELPIATRFNSSMRDYSKSAEAKEHIDRLQMEYQCCGVENLTSWLKTQWFNMSLIRDNTSLLPTDQMYVVNAVPFSCCNTSANTMCTHFPLTSVKDPTIYQTGCANAVPRSFRLLMCFIGGIVGCVMCFMSIVLFVLTQAFATEDKNAVDEKLLLEGREERRLLRETQQAVHRGQFGEGEQDEESGSDDYDGGDRVRVRRKRKIDIRRRKKLGAKRRRQPRRRQY